MGELRVSANSSTLYVTEDGRGGGAQRLAIFQNGTGGAFLPPGTFNKR